MDFNNALSHILEEYNTEFEIINLRQHQLDAFIHIWENKREILMCLSTDNGKFLVYQLVAPLLKLRDKRDKGSVIFIYPLNIIHLDQINTKKHVSTKCRNLGIEGRAQFVDDGAMIREDNFQYVFDDSDEIDDSNEQMTCIISLYTF